MPFLKGEMLPSHSQPLGYFQIEWSDRLEIKIIHISDRIKSYNSTLWNENNLRIFWRSKIHIKKIQEFF
jgi:hypothetical protein